MVSGRSTLLRQPPNYSFNSLRPHAISRINSRVLPWASQLSPEDQVAAPTSPESIRRAARSKRPAAHEVRVDLGRLEAAVAEQHLNGADVGAVFEQVCCEGVAQGVGRDTLGDAGFRGSGSNGSLNTRFVEVMASHDAAARILREAGGGKHPLPALGILRSSAWGSATPGWPCRRSSKKIARTPERCASMG